jgi:hypothetical protein
MSPTTNNSANNEVLPASLMAAALLAVAVAASTLIAQQPDRPSASRSAAEPVVNNADRQVLREEIEAPIFGLTLEERSGGRVFVTAVEPDSRPWKAGFREGDYLVAVGDVKDVPYDKFLENVRDTAATTYEGDSFNVTILRDGRRHVLEVPGAGRTPKDLRKLQARSEKAIEDKLEPTGPTMDNLGAIDKYAAESMASTAEIEEYLKLAQLAQEQELSLRDQRRFGELATVVVGGGFGWGGYGVPADAAPSGTTTVSPGPSADNNTGSTWQRPGANGQPVDAFGNATTDAGAENTAATSGAQVPETGIGTGDAGGTATPGSGIGDGQPTQGTPQATQLGAELRRLQELQTNGGRLSGDQMQRLAALGRLSEFANIQAAQPSRMTPEQMQSLQQAAQSGQLNATQRQNLLQLQRMQLMSEFARSAPGANRNMPAGINPGLNNPGLNNPGLNNPGLNNPGLNNPGLNNPGLGNPGLNNPGVNVPGAGGGTGVGVGGAGSGAGVGTGGASGVGVQGAGSGIGDAN